KRAGGRRLPRAGQPRPGARRPRGRRGLGRDLRCALRRGGARVIIRKSAAEIEGMARAGELLYETLQLVAEHLEPGVSMLELDRIADEHIAARGGVPTSKGYKGFPAALCISPNSMVVHGPPGRGPVLQSGMTLAIEPMITAGSPDVYVHEDDWSISSVDSSLAAHFEHTVAITSEGPRVLTKAGAALLR